MRRLFFCLFLISCLLLSLTSCAYRLGFHRTLSLTVATYNISAGSTAEYCFEAIAADILSANADLIALQEVDKNMARSGEIDTAAYLAGEAGYPYYHFFPALELPDGGEYGLAILSRYPILSAETVKLPSWDYEQRILARAEIDIEGQILQFFTTHLTYENPHTRAAQLERIGEILLSYPLFILTGDFNIKRFWELETIPNTQTVYTEKDNIVTFPRKKMALDHILFSPSLWTFAPPSVSNTGNSDHCLLSAQGQHTYFEPFRLSSLFEKKKD